MSCVLTSLPPPPFPPVQRDAILLKALADTKAAGITQQGDMVVGIYGDAGYQAGSTNTLHVFTV